MKFSLILVPVAAALLAVFWFRGYAAGRGAELTASPLVERVIPFGINLGVWTTWGAEQLSSNIVKNPGLEGMIDRAIVIPVHVAGDSFDDSPAWMARADGFWDQGSYDIRSGASAGSGGTITRSLKRNMFGLPAFVFGAENARPDPGDAVAVTRLNDNELPAQWWFEGAANSFSPAIGEVRPGSPGVRSLRVTAQRGQKTELVSYFDAIGDRAGRLLPLDGRWELTFWTRLQSGGAALQVRFGREGAAPLLAQEVPLSGGWTRQRLTFQGSDAGSAAIAALRFGVSSGAQGQVLIDDVDLRRASDAESSFRQEVVSVLRDLHPHYLRDWEGQLGDTLANRIAPSFGRRSYRYRTGDANQSDFGYGLADFLELCEKTGANPWIVAPTTFSDQECAGLGSYLAAYPGRSHFSESVVEFGNENWNELFRPAGIPDPRTHGEAADRCLAAVREHAGGLPVKTAVNAQHVYVERAIEFARASGASDMEAIAPYFFPSLAEGASSEDALRALFAGDGGALQKIAAAMPPLKKDLAVYEVNVTTTEGNAPGSQRNPVVAGRAAGAALAKTMLDALERGVRRQCAYSLSGFDSKLAGDQGYVRIWGLTRDLGPSRRLRPTGLALKLLNDLLRQMEGGQMLKVQTRGLAGISVYGFHSRHGWAAALVSARPDPVTVDLAFDNGLDGPLPAQALTLASAAWNSTNEDSEEVTIGHEPLPVNGRTVSYPLAPWSMAVLLPQAPPAREGEP